MPEFWIDIESAAGVRQAGGPITNCTYWRYTTPLDRCGAFEFECPLRIDALTPPLTNKLVARCNATGEALGAGIIEHVEYQVRDGVVWARVSGPAIGRELTYSLVGDLSLWEAATVTAVGVHYLSLNTSSSQAVDGSLVDMPESHDGNVATHHGFSGGQGTDWHWIYVGSDYDDRHVTFNVTSPTGGHSGEDSMTVQVYTNEGWHTCIVTSDGTAVDGVTLQQDGTISWVAVANRMRTVENGVGAYWARMSPAIGIDGVQIAEVTMPGFVPTDTALSLIMAKAPTWSLDEVLGTATTATNVYGQLHNETVLEALCKVAEWTGEHFYLTADRKVVWLGTSTPDSGLRAIDALHPLAAEDNPDVVVLADLTKTLDSYEQVTRLYPEGAGLGDSYLDLTQATDSPPAGYTLDAANNYVAYDATDGVQSIARTVQFKDIAPLSLDQAATIYAANQLLGATVARLSQQIGVNTAYTCQVLAAPTALLPGSTLRVAYRKTIAGYVVWSLDEDLTILEATTEVSSAGVRTVGLLLSTTTVRPVNEVDYLGRLAIQARALARTPQAVPLGDIRSPDFTAGVGPLTIGGGGLVHESMPSRYSSYTSRDVRGGLSLGYGSASPAGTGALVTAGTAHIGGAALAIGTNPATSGLIRMPNNRAIVGRNAANSADHDLLAWDASNYMHLGDEAAALTVIKIDVPNRTMAFFNGSLNGRQVVSGVRGTNAGLASLLTALDNIGLIDDQTTET